MWTIGSRGDSRARRVEACAAENTVRHISELLYGQSRSSSQDNPQSPKTRIPWERRCWSRWRDPRRESVPAGRHHQDVQDPCRLAR